MTPTSDCLSEVTSMLTCPLCVNQEKLPLCSSACNNLKDSCYPRLNELVSTWNNYVGKFFDVVKSVRIEN